MTSISIITVCRNAQQHVPGLAASVLAALGPSDEWIVQDGASTDGTVALLRRLGDARIQLESQPDGGVYAAMNRATARATGDYVLFLGADDQLMMHTKGIREHLLDPQTIYYGDVWMNHAQRRYDGAFSSSKLARTNICHQAILYPRQVFERYHYDTRYAIQADWVLNMQCWRDPVFSFAYLDVCIARYNDYDGLSARFVDVPFQKDYPALLRTYFPFAACWRPWARHVIGNGLRRVLRMSHSPVRKQ